MRMVYKVYPLILGLGLAASSGMARAQVSPEKIWEVPGKDAFISPPAALAPKLGEIVLRAQPQAKIEFRQGAWRARYRLPQVTTHLVDETGELSKEGTEKFPADFAEFSIELTENIDGAYYRDKEEPHYQLETFGTTLTSRANLERYFPSLGRYTGDRYTNGFQDVPLKHWSYRAVTQFAQAGLLGDWKPENLGERQSMFRWEVASVAILIRNKIEQEPRKTPVSEELMAALTDLESEFAPEIPDWDEHRGALAGKPISLKPQVRGMTRQPRYKYLSLRFSYGKGVSAAFVEQIKQAVEEYAAQRLKESEAALNAKALQQGGRRMGF